MTATARTFDGKRLWSRPAVARFRVKENVRPYSGRILHASVIERGTLVHGHISGRKAPIVYRMNELDPIEN